MLSFAFGVRIAVVDTNIRRVLSRVFLGVESRGGAASPAERALAGRVLPQDDETDVRDAIEAANARETVNAPESAIREMTQRSTRPSVIWNQSVMELGALVCTAKNRCVTSARSVSIARSSRRAAPGWESDAPARASVSKARPSGARHHPRRAAR